MEFDCIGFRSMPFPLLIISDTILAFYGSYEQGELYQRVPSIEQKIGLNDRTCSPEYSIEMKIFQPVQRYDHFGQYAN